MNTSTSEYLLLFRGLQWDPGLSAAEIERIMNDWIAWAEGLSREGKLAAGQPLRHEGTVVSGKSGRNVADGPFVESKEAVGGYFLLRVSGPDEALAIARQCPTLGYGVTVEVRPVAERGTKPHEQTGRKGIRETGQSA